MKRLLILLCALLMAITSAFSLVGCAFVSDLVASLTNADKGRNPSGDSENTDTVVVSNSTELEQALLGLTAEKKIVLDDGIYNKKVQIRPKAFPIHIFSEDSVSVNGVTVYDGVKDLTVEGITFGINGVEIGRAENVAIVDCDFTLNANITNLSGCTVTNLEVINCRFTNILNNLTTAIKIQEYDGLTVKGCTFDNVEYNAMQVGHNVANGVVRIEGNTFKNIGSRVIYLVEVKNLLECMIIGNEFYDNTDSLLLDNEVDDEIKKKDGIYIHSKSTSGNLIIGQNFWEIIPAKNWRYIASVAQYDVSEQTLIQD